MDWFAPIDLYCERLTEAFWAEPLNAMSNISFLIAAGFGAKRARIEGGGIMAWVLVALAALIGIGSFLFHTFANGWSELADVIPIWSFIAIYVLALIAKLKGRAPERLAAGCRRRGCRGDPDLTHPLGAKPPTHTSRAV